MIEKSRRPWRRLENRMASRDAAAAFKPFFLNRFSA